MGSVYMGHENEQGPWS